MTAARLQDKIRSPMHRSIVGAKRAPKATSTTRKPHNAAFASSRLHKTVAALLGSWDEMGNPKCPHLARRFRGTKLRNPDRLISGSCAAMEDNQQGSYTECTAPAFIWFL